MVHILLKPGLENFEHYFTRVLDECSCVVVEVLEFQLSYFKSFKKDAVKVLHSICQQIWKTQQWPQDWKRSVFIPIPKKGNVKECLNYHTIALIPYLIAWLKYWKTKQMGQMFELISVIKISILTMLCPIHVALCQEPRKPACKKSHKKQKVRIYPHPWPSNYSNVYKCVYKQSQITHKQGKTFKIH